MADAVFGWLDASPGTGRSTRNVVRCRCTISSRFAKLYYFVSDDGKELVSEDLKEWLTSQACYKSDAPLYSPRSNGLDERTSSRVVSRSNGAVEDPMY